MATVTTIVEEPRHQEIRPIPWAPIAWFGILLIAGYWPVLKLLVRQWIDNEDMGHGFFVPAVAGYIAWQNREKWMHLPLKWNPAGLLVILIGTAQLVAATLGVEFFLARTAFLVTLAGILIFAGSWPLFKQMLFPLFLLAFMIPIPEILYNQITFPLQMFASQVAEWGLTMMNIPVLREGNILEIPSQRLSVVEACSGIRSLLSLTFLSLAYGYFFESRTWMRVFIFFVTIPIAIIANATRVTLTGLFSEWDPELAQGIFHTMEGWVIFVIAMAMLYIVHRAASAVAGGNRSGK
jgi:exosortase